MDEQEIARVGLLVVGLLVLILLFALYVRLFPTPLSGEMFANGPTAPTNKNSLIR